MHFNLLSLKLLFLVRHLYFFISICVDAYLERGVTTLIAHPHLTPDL
jgi:hypothetical protein